MSSVQAFIDRQLGNCHWTNYDTAIHQLRCRAQDDYTHLAAENVEEPCEAPVFACKFAQAPGHEHILALANEDGQIAIHNTEPNAAGACDRYGKTAHYNAIFDLAWMFGEMKLVSVSGDHTARLFDVSRSDIVEHRIFHGHTRSVKTVAFRKDDPAVFATGARDGAIFVWDTRANYNFSYITQPDRVIANSHNVPGTPVSGAKFRKKLAASQAPHVSGVNSVTGLAFQNDMTLISCGAGDGAIKVWDLRKHYGIRQQQPLPRHVLPHAGSTTRNGFTSLLVDASGLRLYVNCMDNTIYCYNIATYQAAPVMAYTGHHNASFYIKAGLSADGAYLVSGSSDQHAYIWNTRRPTPLVSLAGHAAEVTCVAWCQAGEPKLVTCADDMRHKVWKVYDEAAGEDWAVSGRGAAVRHVHSTCTTPSARKRTVTVTPHSQQKRSRTCERCQLLTPGSADSLQPCESCTFSAVRSTKRSATQAALSPGGAAKKQQTDKGGARRLFGSLPEAGTARDSDAELATILEETAPAGLFSPTANLPNFVVDGAAPHLKNFSPQKKQDRDWLTKMRVEQSLRNQMEVLARPSSPKQPRLSSSEQPGPKLGAGRRAKRQGNSRAQSPLLKFFRVTNGPRSCERQCNSSLGSMLTTANIATELR